jgi:hypothetical protein
MTLINQCLRPDLLTDFDFFLVLSVFISGEIAFWASLVRAKSKGQIPSTAFCRFLDDRWVLLVSGLAKYQKLSTKYQLSSTAFTHPSAPP